MRARPSCPALLRLAGALALAAALGCAGAPVVPAPPSGCNLTTGRSRAINISPTGEIGKKIIPLACTGKPYAELEIYLGDESHARGIAVRYLANAQRVWVFSPPQFDPEAPFDWTPMNENDNRYYNVYDVKWLGDGRTVSYRVGGSQRLFDVVEGKKK